MELGSAVPWDRVWVYAAGLAPPVKPLPLAARALTSVDPSAPTKVTNHGVFRFGSPRTTTLPAPIVGNACSALRTWTAVALRGMGAVVRPLKVRVYVPPVGLPVSQ